MKYTHATESGIEQQIDSLRKLRRTSPSACRWRCRAVFDGHRAVAREMRGIGIPLTEALLILFNKRERYTHAKART